ncbi:MAG: ParB/RepB/Spo0J family partition protein [Clostridia bacterium]|nr:ParB/RepB/Spo0J family partition protein [Clostridia bacterium]
MAVKRDPRRSLGRGLDALIPTNVESAVEAEILPAKKAPEYKDGVIELDIDKVMSNKAQPRKFFDDNKIVELAESIKEHGVIQPIIVKKNGDNWMIIAGERRWRASRVAGLKKIPAIIKDYSERELMEVSLIENIQREDLNPIEEAEAYEKLIEEYNFTQENLGKSVGKDRSTITNSLRLLKSSEEVREKLITGELSTGHARAILGLQDKSKEPELLKAILGAHLSVRETEKLVKKYNTVEETPAPVVDEQETAAIADLQDRMIKLLGTKVSLSSNKGKGKVVIEFYSNEDLDRILEVFERGQGK